MMPNSTFFTTHGRSMAHLCFTVMAILLATGYWYVWQVPMDATQGMVFKILYIHVPSAWLALGFYGIVAFCSLLYVVWRNQVASLMAYFSAWVGTIYTLVCLITGSIWGKPTWGAWWVWDARLTSMAFLFILYIGYLLLAKSFAHRTQGLKFAGYLAIIGSINLPIIKWSVEWWHTLHQTASVLRLDGPTIAWPMLWPLLICASGWLLYGIGIVCWLLHTELQYLKTKHELILQQGIK
jgi:heme exporter protein C